MELGHIIGRFAKAEADGMIMHDDVRAWGAPSECHNDVAKSADDAWDNIEKELGITFEEARKLAEKRITNFHRSYDEAVGRIYHRDNPFINF